MQLTPGPKPTKLVSKLLETHGNYADIKALAIHLFSSTLTGQCSEEELSSAEKRLGFRPPQLLRYFYKEIGYKGVLGQTQESLLSPDRFSIHDGALVFCVENQGVCLWGIRVMDLQLDDPPVVRASNESPLVWEIDHEHLSDFWITFIYWQTINGALGTVGINGNATDAVLTEVEGQWPEIRLGPNNWGVRFFGTADQFICIVGDRQIQAAATTGDGLREIEALLGVEWDYSQYDGKEAE
jgi:hypothetical protein